MNLRTTTSLTSILLSVFLTCSLFAQVDSADGNQDASETLVSETATTQADNPVGTDPSVALAELEGDMQASPEPSGNSIACKPNCKKKCCDTQRRAKKSCCKKDRPKCSKETKGDCLKSSIAQNTYRWTPLMRSVGVNIGNNLLFTYGDGERFPAHGGASFEWRRPNAKNRWYFLHVGGAFGFNPDDGPEGIGSNHISRLQGTFGVRNTHFAYKKVEFGTYLSGGLSFEIASDALFGDASVVTGRIGVGLGAGAAAEYFFTRNLSVRFETQVLEAVYSASSSAPDFGDLFDNDIVAHRVDLGINIRPALHLRFRF